MLNCLSESIHNLVLRSSCLITNEASLDCLIKVKGNPSLSEVRFLFVSFLFSDKSFWDKKY